MNALSKSHTFTITAALQIISCTESKLKEFAAMYSYHYTCIPTDCRYHLIPNNRFPQPHNDFRPEIDCHLIQPNTLSVTLSLPTIVRTMIALLYLIMFLFLGIMAVKQVPITAIAIWSVLFFSTSLFLLLGKMAAFHLTISRLMRLFEVQT